MASDDRDYRRDSARRIMRDHYYNPKAYRRDRESAPGGRWGGWRRWVIAAAVVALLYHYGHSLPAIEAVRVLLARLV